MRNFLACHESFPSLFHQTNCREVKTVKSIAIEEYNEQSHRQFTTNVLGLILATQEAVKQVGPEGGSVIKIGSNASQLSPPTSAVYTATKGAVDSVTHVLAKELGARKIRVNSINPGAVET